SPTSTSSRAGTTSPRSSRSSASSTRAAEQPSVGADADAALVEALADEELERRPRPALRVEHPVDLPLGQHRLVGLSCLGPVGELRQVPELAGEVGTLVDRALEPLLAERDVEAGLAEGVRERAEGVPVERLGRHAALVLVDVARGRRA